MNNGDRKLNAQTRKLLKRMLALLIAVVLVAGLGLSYSADRVLKATSIPEEEAVEGGAEPAAEEPPVTTQEITLDSGKQEPAKEEPAPQPEPEPEPQPQPEPENVASAEPQAGSDASSEKPEGGKSQEATAEAEGDAAETEAETETQPEAVVTEEVQPELLPEQEAEQEKEEIRYPAQKLTAKASDGAMVTVDAPEGALPEGSRVTIKRVSSKAAKAAIESTLGDDTELVDVVVYDIVIYDHEGKEVQPDSSVKVSITGAGLEAGEEASLYHVDGNSADKVSDVADPGQVSFNASHFSEYAIATTSSAGGDEADTGINTVMVGSSITLTAPSGYRSYTWSVSPKNYVTVSSNGREATVTGVKAGTVTVSCKMSSGGWFSSSTTEEYTVRVTEQPRTPEISISPKTATLNTIGATQTFRAELSMIDADNSVVWTSSDPSIATVENGVVTAKDEGTVTITASVSPEEDELYGNTYSDSATVNVAFSSYNVYHYALIPGASADTVGTAGADASWFGLGVTKVSGVPNPTSIAYGAYNFTYKIGAAVNGKTLFPDLTYGGTTYKYAAPGSAEAEQGGYYTVTPFRLVVANGANAGNNKYNSTVGSGKTYHLDYMAVLNEKSYVSASFVLRDADSTGYEALMDYGQRFRAGTSQSQINKPSASVVPATKKFDGITYSFDGWYLDEGCTQKADFAGTIESNMTFYGRYIPTNARYRVEYYYDGVIDASLTEVKGPVELGTVVSTFDPKAKNGFNLSDVEPSSITVSENEEDNIIRVYYTKRLVTYRVGYYIAGTNESIAPAVSKTCKFGETGTGTRQDIAGYTPADGDKTKSMVIEASGSEIRFYYYKNVTLTANSAEFAYNGEPHAVSGYTCDQPDADFGDIAAGAEGTAAGTYEAVFTADLTGRVDNTGRYIVTGTKAGSLVIRPAEVIVTANASGKAYGQDDPALTASVSGLAAADEGAIEYTITRDPGEEVGEYAIHAAGEAEQGNYHVTYQDSTFTISKSDELGLVVNGFEGVYDGQSHAVSAIPSVTEGTTIEYSTDGGSTWSPEPPAITNVGETAVSVRAVNPGYEDAAAETVLRITPRPVTITAVSTGKTFGEPDPELTADVTGTIGEDTVSYTVQRSAGESAGTYEIMAAAAADQGNYTVTTVPGEFTINKAVMETSPMNIVKAYDGQPVSGQIDQAVPAGTVVSYSVDGENWTDVPPSRTDAGMVMYTIRLENPDYETAFIPSVISIAKRNVILRSGSDSKEYDGNALTNSDVSVSGDGFAEGEGAEFNVTGTQTVVGTSANTFEYTLNEGTSELNYDISTEFGKLEVTSRDAQFEINLKVNGGDYLYDGKMKVVSGFESQYFTLNGNKYYVDGMEAYLEATDAGEYTVIATGEPHVYDAAENEVTDQFKVGSIDGKLNIRKRQITLTSASANRPYNGAPLINETVTVSGDDFAPEEGAFFSVTGKQTAVGSSENTFAYFLNEGTKAANYEITTVPGSLTVTSRPDDAKYEITVSAAGGEFTYDGTEHEVSGVMNASGEAADKDGALTFKVDGHDYTVSGLTAKASAVNAGTYRVNVTGTPVVRDEEGNDVTSEFVVNTLSGDLVITKRSVTLTSASDSHRYNGKPLMNDKVTVGGDGFVRGEGAEYTVTGSQTVAGSSPNRFTYVLSDGTLAENYDIQTEFGTLTITNRDVKYEIEAVAKSGSFVYDGEEKSISGLEAYEFEVEGSKYTLSNVNAEATGIAAGTYTSLITGTPVVTDADGNDVTEQFAVSLVPGKLEITRRSVILTSADAEKQYDGKPLTNSTVTTGGDGFVEGENVIIEVTGSRTLPGTSENTFNYYAAGGTDLNNYDISTVPGRLLVRARDAKYEITMRAPGQSVLFDGKAHQYDGFETNEFEIEGNKFTVSGLTVSCRGTDAGTYNAEVSGSAVVTDADGNDVTGQFIVNTDAGDIVILPREVVLTSGTSTKEYDGEALTNDEVTVSGDGFIKGEGAAFTVTGTQKTVGSSANTFTYSLNAGTKAGNYRISEVPGTLTVTNRDAKYSITVNANSGSFKYDGAEKTVEGLIEDTFTVDGNVYTVSGLTAQAAAVHAGTYPVNITGTAVVTDADGNDVTDQFAVTPVNGTLEITKRNVILTSASAEKVYDGTALVNNEVTVGGDGFAEGEGATYNVTGKRTIVGFIANLFSYILNDGTEAGDYNISVVPGQLNIFGRPEAEKYEVSVAANSGSFMYDGEAHEVSGLVGEEEGKLTVAVGGNTYTISGLTASATLRDAGTAAVAVEGQPSVTDADGNDVTSEFRIKPVSGTIEVTRRSVVMTSASDSKQYDGEALTNNEVTVSGDGFVEGEGASYAVTGSQKLVGSSENSFTYSLNAGTKADNYSVSVVPGTLTVTNRDAKYEITVEAKSGSYKYSGTKKSVEGFKEETFEVEGNTYTVSGLTASAAATDAGTYPVNVVGTAKVTDAAGNDVTEQFAVTPVNGTLEITKRYVELTSASANKQYDGKSLTAQEVTVSRDGFAEGEGAEYAVTGSQTLVGSSDNTFSYNLTAATKADNYIIKTVPGRLTVSDREAKYEITLKPKSDSVIYDGQKHVVEGFESTEFTFDGVTYSVTGINARAAGMNAGEHPVVIEGGAVILDADGNDVTTQFITNIAPASLTISKRSVTLTSGTSAKEYDGQALTNDEVTVSGDGFAEGEGAAFKVTGTQKTVGSSENAFTYELKRGTSADNYNITTVPGTLTVTNRDAKYSITVTANSGSFKYDGAEKTVEGLVADTFEVEGNTYTVSGLTAAGTGTHAGTYPVIITGTAVVTDADGNDVTDQFAVTPVNGTLEITKRNVILISASAEKVYDGTALVNNEVTVTGDGFAEGEGATYAVSGKRTIVGFIANFFSYILNDGTEAGDYNISVVPGQLNIFGRPEAEKYEVSVAANSGSFVYDGEDHTVSGLAGEEEGKLTVAVGGNTYTIRGLTASATLRDAGTAAVAVEGQPSVTDADGNDVTSEFRIKPVSGTIEVQKRNVILTSASESKQYDGEALANDEVTVSGDGFVEGEGASYSVTGSQKLVGSSENSFTYSLNAGTKADNYSVSVVPGTLTVTNRDAKYEITVEAKSGSYKYSGTEKSVEGFKEETFEVEGNTYTVSGLTASATATDAGTYPVNVTGIAVVTDAAGNDVTEQFAVTPVNGTLEITKRYVELTSSSANKQYDGKSLTAQEVTVSRDGFAEGEGADFTVTGSQTLVGSSDNTFSYNLTAVTKADNYIIKTVPGRLTVSDREAKYEITLRPKSDAVVYDGQKHVVEGFESTEFTFDGVTYSVTGINARAAGMNAGEHPVVIEGGAVILDADGNDVTTQFITNIAPASLTISKRSVTLTSGTSAKEYDGQALTNDEVTVSGEGFAEGEGAAFNVTGTQKTVGSSENVFTYELKRNTNAENYSITTVPGTLTVTNRDAKYSITVTANSGSFKYDGAEKTVEGLIEDTFTVDGNVYTVSGLTAAVTGTHAGTYPVNITGTAVVTDADGNDVTDQFAVTPVNGTLEITKRNVILTSASAEKVYDGTALVNNEVTVGGDGFAEGEGATYNVTGKRTIVGFIANLFSYILNDGTNAGDYNISVVPGQLNIFGRPEAEKYEVSVAANSGSFMYDGEAHEVSGLAGEEEGKLTVAVGGNTYTISGLTASATLRDAGTAAVAVEGQPSVTDADGNDVTSEFRIKPVSGTIEVQKRNVILTSASESKQYDGEALINDEVTVSGDGFVEGEGASYSVTGSQKLVGSSENSFTYSLNTGTKADNYSVSVVPGTLTVTNRDAKYEVTIEAKSGSYKYNGTVKTVEGFKEETFEVEGNTYTVSGLTASAAATDAGTYPVNVVGVAKVTDAAGNDVTEQFAVTPVNGTLEIGKRYVELTSANANKQYDGKSLTAQEVTVSRDGFAEGEGAEYAVTGSQTLVGSSDNTFSYSLKDGTKADNYIIKTVPGRLTVSDREAKFEITLRPKSGAATYDGQKHVVEGFEETEFTFDGVTYTVSGINARAAGTNAGEHPVVIEGGAVILDADGNDVTTQFITNIAPASLTISKRSVTLTSGTSAKEYDGQALTNDVVTVTGDGFAEGEGAEFKVTGTQKTVGSSENVFKYELKRGTSADNYNITTVPGTLTVTNRDAKYSITVTANSGSFKYDGAEKTVEGLIEDTFTVDGNVYTVSGLTAQAAAVHAGTYPVNITGIAVVTDAEGNDVTDQFAVTPVNGTLEITKRNVILTSANAEKVYDGTALRNDEITVTGDGFAEGQGAEYKVTGTRTIRGASENSFTYALTEGTLAADYDIRTIFGMLTVKGRPEEAKYEVSVAAASGTFKYDGAEHAVSGLVLADGTTFADGEAVTFTAGGNEYTLSGLRARASGTAAGEYTVAVTGTPIVRDADGNDVTEEFIISMSAGQMNISKRDVVLTSADAVKEYDGKPLTNGEVTVSGDAFAEGEGAEFTVTGTQTIVGTSENTFVYSLISGTSANNYNIITRFGSLNVTNRDAKFSVTMRANSGSFMYDGTAKTVEGFEGDRVLEDGSHVRDFSVEGNIYTVSGLTATGSALHAGSHSVAVTGIPVVRDAEGNDVTEQFSVLTENGTLNISKRSVILSSAGGSAMYTGDPLTAADITVSGDGFAEGEGAVYTVSGRQTIPGSSENKFTYILAGGTLAEDYDISTEFGTLTILGRGDAKYEITAYAAGGSAVYDGEEHTAGGFVAPDGEVIENGKPLTYKLKGKTYTVEGLNAAAAGTNAGSYQVNVTGSPLVRDADGNDVSSEFLVHTVNSSLEIAKRSVTLTSADGSQSYNGSPLTNDKVTVGGDGFVRGEGAEFTVTGSQTVAGSSPNSFTYALNEGTLAENYDIVTELGTLTVTDRDVKYEIKAEATSGSYLYDGKEKSADGIVKTTFDVEGHTYTLSGISSAVTAQDAGIYNNVITGEPIVTDEAGNDVTAQFAVSLVPGKLEITKRTVTLTSADAEKQYDGTPLTNTEVAVSGDGFAEGEGAVCRVTGSQLITGRSGNEFEYVLATGTKAGNYEISKVIGTLLVRDRDAKYEITLRAPGQRAVYDGAAHEYESFETTEFEIEGNKYTVSGINVSCSGTDAGTYTAKIKGSAVVTDADGNDVTGQFIVNTDAGDIVILPREVVLTSGTSAKEYDGEALTNDAVTVSGDGFIEGEGASFTVTGSQKTVGSSANSFTYELNDGTKSGNYRISEVPGTLTITNRDAKYSITVNANSGSFKYDGTEKAVEGLIRDTFEVDGNTYTVSGLTAAGTGTHAGTYPVSITGTAVVTDADGNDVTDQFAVTPVSGTLEITKRNVILTSASAEKVYDGTALVSNEVTVTGDGFVEGEGATYNVSGKRTIVGFIANLFSYILNDGTEAGDYNISVVPGQLNIFGRPDAERYEVSVAANSGTFVYDGEDHTVSGLAGEEEGKITARVGGNAYTISGLTASATLRDAGTAAVTIEGKPVVTDAEGNDVTNEFRIKPVNGTIEVTRRSVVMTSESDSKQYDGEALTNDEVTVTGDGFAEGEGASYSVTGSQKLVGSSENSFTYSLDAGTKADNYSVSVVPGTLTVTNRDAKYEVTVEAKSGSYKYNGTEKTVEGFKTETFEVEGNTYTVSGLTASAAATDAGTYPVNVVGTAKVTDAAGNDVTEQFAVTPVNGTLEITKRYVELTSANANKQYDGKSLTAQEVTVSRDGFAEGEGADFTVTGSQTLVGSSDNSFSYSLKEGTKADNYIIRTVPGKLTVSDRAAKYEITLRPNSDSVVYDGQKHVVEGFEETEFTFDGVTYTVTGINARAAGMNAGEHPVVIEGGAVILDADGNDVTTQFITHVAPASLTISKRAVTLTSGTSAKEYDGQELTNAEVTVSGEGFAEGEGAEFKVTGTQKTVGSSENVFTYELKRGTSADNYNITTVPGTLTVTNRDAKYSITVTANSGTFKYDGAEKMVEGLTEDTFEVEGNTYTVSGLTVQTAAVHAGTYPVNIIGTAVVRDDVGNDVSDQFAVTPIAGTLEITKRTAVFTSADAEKEYDGQPLTNNEVTVTGDGFAEGEGAEFTVTGSRVLAGESENSFTYALTEGTLAADYDISVVPGKLTVNNRSKKFEISLKPVKGEALYDGAEHKTEGFEKSEFTFGGVTYTVSGLSASASGTDAGRYPVNVTGKAAVTDPDGNDVTDQFSISVMPAELVINPRTVIMTSASATGEYNGEALRSEEVTVTGDGFAEGEGAEYTFTGAQTLVGISENTFEYALTEGTKAENYVITTAAGTLNVTGRETAYSVTVRANSGTFKYDGAEKAVDGFITSTFDVDGNTYTVSGLTAHAALVHAGKYPVNITGTPAVRDASGNDVTDQFRVETVPGTLEITRRAVTITSGSAEKAYDGGAITSDEISVGGDGFAEGEGAVYEFSGSRIIPGSSENAFTYTLNEGTLASDYDIRTEYGMLAITKLSEDARYEIAVSARGGSFKYDGEEHSAGGLISRSAGRKAEGTEDNEDTTLTVVINGHPYTVTGLEASRTEINAGSYKVNVTGTPVVLDSNGNDVTDQFVIRLESAVLNIAKREITLTSGSSTHAYNGKPLTNGNVEVSGDGFAEGEGASYDVTGTRTVVGTSSNDFTYSLNDGTSADNYTISTVFGQLNVTGRDAKYLLTMTPQSGSYLYDGEQKSVSGFISTHAVIEGNRYEVSGLTASAEGTAAGKYAVKVSGTPVITDADGNDVSDQFAVEVEPATLEIRPRQIVLRSPDVSKEYDGTPLTGEEVAVEGDGFAGDDGVTLSNHSSRTIVGVTQNSFDWTFNEGTDAGNYDVSTVFGYISITGRDRKYEVKLVANSDSVEYDGNEHTVTGFAETEFVIENNEFNVTGIESSATGTEPGVYGTVLEGDAVVSDADGHDVTGEFAVSYVSGALTITEKPQAAEEAPGAPAATGGDDEDGGDDGDNGGGGQPADTGAAGETGAADQAEADTASVEDTGIPYASAPSGYWALMNLIMAVLSVILALINGIRWLFGRKKDDEDEEESQTANADAEDESASKKHRGSAVIAAIVLAIVSVVAFFLTEDMSNTMAYFDKYTILMAVLLIGTLITNLFGKKKSDDPDDSSDE